MNDFKVDYVITYLDPTDPYWLEKFSKYKKAEFKKQPTRYDTDGVKHLKYHFRSIAKNMPWINNVYLVVFSESQVPKWINRSKVKIIVDEQYIPKKYLPTFNTSTKQMHLQFIPGLEEHFIFADDDLFTINPVSQESFFDTNGNPRPDNIKKERVYMPKSGQTQPAPGVIYNSVKLAHDMAGVKYNPNPIISETFCHAPHPVLKSDLQKYYEKYSDYISKTITPCRDKKNVIGITWCVLNQIKYGNKTDLRVKEIVYTNKNLNHSLTDYKKKGVQVVNINNTQGKSSTFYQNQLEKMFPTMCEYEIEQRDIKKNQDNVNHNKPQTKKQQNQMIQFIFH